MPNAAAGHILDVPGARLHYQVRGSGPVLMMIGLPMDSTDFAPIASLLADEYRVVTYDPRGISRSTIEDPDQDSTPELVAEDVHRVLSAVTSDPVDVFGSSGGAVTGIALATRHPEQVRTLVAHEPPLVELLPDGVQIRAAIDHVYDTFRRHGPAAAWPEFLAVNGVEVPAGEPAAQDPASPQVLANGNRMLAHCLRPTTRYRPDLTALRTGPTRVVVGGGTTSAGQLPHRTAVALAEQLGSALIEFPGDHDGFIGDPVPFAETLREVLARGRRPVAGSPRSSR